MGPPGRKISEFIELFCRPKQNRLKISRYFEFVQPSEPKTGGKKQHLCNFYRRNHHNESTGSTVR